MPKRDQAPTNDLKNAPKAFPKRSRPRPCSWSIPRSIPEVCPGVYQKGSKRDQWPFQTFSGRFLDPFGLFMFVGICWYWNCSIFVHMWWSSFIFVDICLYLLIFVHIYSYVVIFVYICSHLFIFIHMWWSLFIFVDMCSHLFICGDICW